ARDIDSVFGLCTILSKKRDGATFVVHVECKGPGGSQMLGDVIFKPREDKTIDFSDLDQTYEAVLHRCPDWAAAARRSLCQSRAHGPAPRAIFVPPRAGGLMVNRRTARASTGEERHEL